MTEIDVKNIFVKNIVGETIILSATKKVTIENFLHIAGFSNIDPTEAAMLAFDGGAKGYAELIEQGNFAQ